MANDVLKSVILSLGFFLGCVDALGMLTNHFLENDVAHLRKGIEDDPGSPVFLTPYIEKGDIAQALKLSAVADLGNLNVTSYAGFLTVNKSLDSNLYFWFFPSENKSAADPVLLWLQGGPGGSSLFGLFVEHGPYVVASDLRLSRRKFSWTNKYSMLYIDNPIGTGFSFTKSPAGYSTTQKEIAENLYIALCQFFQLFPNLQQNDFYITGESYAGKYVPALAYWIQKNDKKQCVNLKGVAIGDGLSDPPVMIDAYPDLLFNTGLIDENHKQHFLSEISKIHVAISKQDYLTGFKIWDTLLNGDLSGSSYFQNITGCTNYFNYLRCGSPIDYSYYPLYLNQTAIRRAIHVGSLTYNSGDEVEKHLILDILQSVSAFLSSVMDNYKVLLYSGQLDIIVGAPLTELMLQKLPWSRKSQYLSADRMVWKINPSDLDVAGYVRQVKDFYQVVVKGGGHILPYDQPERTFDMIQRFIEDRGFRN